MVYEWNKDSFKAGLGDATASMMDACLRCCHVVAAVVTHDVASMDPESWGDIDWLGQLRKNMPLDIDSVAAVGIRDSGWCGVCFSELLEHRPAVERLGDPLASDLEMWGALAKFGIDLAPETSKHVETHP